MSGHIQTANESPQTRNTILGTFLRGRPRNTSQSHIPVHPDLLNHHNRESSPQPRPPSPTPPSRRRTVLPAAPQTTHNISNSTTSGLGITSMLRRRRSAGNVVAPAAPPIITASATAAAVLGVSPFHNRAQQQSPMPPQAVAPPAAPAHAAATAVTSSNSPPAHRIRLVPHLDTRRTLRFDAISRDLREGDPVLRIGRFTERSGQGLNAVNALGSNKLAFRSKVVSRAHAEIWVESGGRFFIKDTKSSSGTFLNHVRLSPANTESRAQQLKDGDILQLGMDYQGGAEDIYKSVKIRIEVGREWQAGANAFNTNALKNLKSLALPSSTGKQPASVVKLSSGKSHNIPDCCICLFSVTIRQALFIAPCSHTFHYKCIRPLLETHHPAFSCPLCRTFADLEEDVEVEVEIEYEDEEVDDDLQEGAGDEKPLPIPHETQDSDAAEAYGDSPRDSQHDMIPANDHSRAGFGLAGRYEGGGAETEVEEGVSGLGPGSRIRHGRRAAARAQAGAGGSGNGDRASPLDLTDEQDEGIMDMAEVGYVAPGEEGFDMDGTVGGKWKR